MRKWANRSEETAYLLNPSFLSLLILNGMESYSKVAKKGVPFVFPFILMPLVLHNQTRKSFPQTVRTTFSSWITDVSNAMVKVDFAKHSRLLSPYVKEGLIFALQTGKARISDEGHLFTEGAVKKSFKNASAEVDECIRASIFCGKWLGKTGDFKTALALLGVRP